MRLFSGARVMIGFVVCLSIPELVTPAFAIDVRAPNPAIPAWQLVDVRQYGAKGDGTTDDTAALTAALSSAAGKTLFFPSGTYLHSSTLSVASSTTVIGYGATLRAASGTADEVTGLSLSGVSKITIR